MKYASHLKRTTLILIIGLILAPACSQTKSKLAVISPGNPAISVIGRSEQTKQDAIAFDWPGVSIEFNFRGTGCSILLDDSGHNYFNLFIDDMPPRVFEVNSDTILELASDLRDTLHHVLITRRTEGFNGITSFSGLIMEGESKLADPPVKFKRKIEFIGNSITCGYGTEAIHRDDPFVPEEENNYKSYAPVMARAFQADAHIIAHSGQGLVRNYGDKKPVSDYNMPDRYLQVYDSQKKPFWDFQSWKPDLVVINLGTNDFSTQPHPDEKVFTSAYLELIDFIRVQYGNIPVFCIVGPMTNEPSYSYVKNMVEVKRNEGQDHQVYFVGIPTYLLAEEDWGAYHPKYSGQIKMAAHVAPVISSVMGWEYGPLK